MRALPRRDGAPGGSPPPPRRQEAPRVTGSGARAARGDRGGDEGCIHLRPRTDRVQCGRVRGETTQGVPMTATHAGPLVPLAGPRRDVELTIDGKPVTVPEGTTILDACARLDQTLPTLCYLETLHPVNACRVCVVEVEGSRVLVPACSRAVEPGMKVKTDTPRVKHSRKMVLEFLASSVDLSTAPNVSGWLSEYGARPDRYGPPDRPGVEGDRDSRSPGHHEPPQNG